MSAHAADGGRDGRLAALERERDALRATLAAAEGNFRSAFLETPAGMSLSRVDNGKILDMNDAFLHILGFAREEVIGRTSAELNLWTSEDQRAALIGELRGRGKVVAREERMRRKDGSIATVLFSAVAATVAGEPHTITWVLDVSPRREAEEALRASEARWRSLVEQAPTLVIVTDAAGVVRFVNRSLSGRPLEPMIGQPVFAFVPEAYRAEARRIFARVVAERAPVPFTHYLERVGGGLVWLDSFIAPVLRDGQLESVMIISTDVTRRVEAEESRRESEQRLRGIVESMGEWYWEMDAAGRITFSSEHCLRMIGRTPAEMLGRSPVEFAEPEDQQRQRQYLAEHGTPPRPVRNFEGWYLHPDGRRVRLAVSGVPVFAGDGSLAGWRGVAHDVTERTLAEAERAAIEAKMQQAQKLESLGILAGGIAHDFNNLLAAVLGNAELALADLPPGTPARDSVEQIQKAGLHAAELTRQMLAYAGRGAIALQPVSLQEVVRDMAQLLGASVSKRHLLALELAQSLPATKADPAQLRQIVMNLVINASEAIGEREGTVTVRTAAVGPGTDVGGDLAVGDLGGGEHVLLEVSDTGAGMDTATLQRIFDPFFTTKFAGRGLGLAAVLGIVRRHGGALRVRSRPGEGSCFSVLLPAGECAIPAPTPVAATGLPGSWRGSGTVLLVDDEEPVRNVAARMLRTLGFDVLTAADGAEALARVGERRGTVRAVLLDLTMPRMDGEETLRGMRRTAPDLPVVLCSGYDVLERRERFADLPFSGFLQKPFRLADLERALRGALRE